MVEREVDQFRSSTGRWLLGSFAGWATLLSCVLGIGFVLIGWRWLRNAAIRYEVTDQRLILRRGLVLKTVDEIELYRIKDVRLDFPLLNQLTDIGTITIRSSDPTTGDAALRLRDVPMARERREGLRALAERARLRCGVREFDVGREEALP